MRVHKSREMSFFRTLEFVLGDTRLKCNNVERNNFVHGLITNIGNMNRLIVMGHSRGSENAIGVAARNLVL